MLCSALLKRILDLQEKAKKNGFSFTVEELFDGAVFLSHSKTGKTALLGSFALEENEKPVIVSYFVDLHYWHWANQEGFSKDDILNKPELKNRIFEFVPVSQIFGKLN